MGRSQVLYNQKRPGRGRGRGGGRGDGGRGGRTTSSSGRTARSQTTTSSSIAPLRQPLPDHFSNDEPSVAEKAEHLLSLGSATANATAALRENDNDPFVYPMGEKLNPVALGLALHEAYDRCALLRLPPHIVKHVYGTVKPTATTAKEPETTTLIDVTGWPDGRDERSCQEEESKEEPTQEDADCVVYLGTKQPTDQDNEDDLDGWLDSVIS